MKPEEDRWITKDLWEDIGWVFTFIVFICLPLFYHGAIYLVQKILF